MKKIAITGGIAAGKSSVGQILKSLGAAYLIDSDEIVHNLLSPETLLGQKIISLLGSDIVSKGQFDRKKIANLVFSHPDQLNKLESLLHPHVIEEINKRYELVKNSKSIPLFVVEIPLLYEIKQEDLFDAVITVISDENISLSRSKLNPQEYTKRMHRQISPKEKAARSDFVIQNNGNKEELLTQVKNLIPSLVAI